jgi:hypothetical protein
LQRQYFQNPSAWRTQLPALESTIRKLIPGSRRWAMALGSSERVRLIKEIARSMRDEDWSHSDLIFREFGVPHDREGWGGDEDNYVIYTLRDATDEHLTALAAHYGLSFVQAKSTIDPTCWTPGFSRLFISHLAKYREEAGKLQEGLRDFGISAFVAHNDIEPTSEWQDEIEKALATCDAMAALLRDGFHQSKWTDQEIGYAMGQERLVIAVRMGEDPYGFIGRFQAINGMPLSPGALALEIFNILKKNVKTKDRVACGLVASFVGSNSYAQARTRTTLLARAEYWDKTLSERCLAAFESNRQIKDANGVQSQLANIIKSHNNIYT